MSELEIKTGDEIYKELDIAVELSGIDQTVSKEAKKRWVSIESLVEDFKKHCDTCGILNFKDCICPCHRKDLLELLEK